MAGPNIGDVFAALDDRAIRLRAAGMTYAQMATELGISCSEAKRRYRAARARQIPPAFRPRRHPRPNGFVVAWAAGFFDGEGCAYGYESIQRGYRRFTFGVTVTQVDRSPLERLQQHWGGTINAQPTRLPSGKDMWRWLLRGLDAGHFLADIRPHLTVKAAAADAAMPCLLGTHGHGIPFSSAEVEHRRAAVARLAEINRRGRPRES